MTIFLSFASYAEKNQQKYSVKTDERWKIATLEWPPYTCSRCPNQGAGILALREALMSVGVAVEFEFLPWVRAIKEGGSDEFMGYFPAWPEEIKPPFVASPSLFKSPLGFLEHKDSPLNIKKIQDLKGKVIGGVTGYGYTDHFYSLANEGLFKLKLEYSDSVNLKTLAKKRVDGVIIDTVNAKYFLKNEYSKEGRQLFISDFILANKDLLIAINPRHASNVLPKLQLATKKINTQKLVDEWLKRHQP